jgi:hypothetical protein
MSLNKMEIFQYSHPINEDTFLLKEKQYVKSDACRALQYVQYVQTCLCLLAT